MDSVTDIVFTPAGGPKVQSSLKYPYPCKLYQPLNRCAYCGSTEELSTEHIIPIRFGGKLILPMQVAIHRKATSKIEDFILRKYLIRSYRSYLSLPSRRPQESLRMDTSLRFDEEAYGGAEGFSSRSFLGSL